MYLENRGQYTFIGKASRPRYREGRDVGVGSLRAQPLRHMLRLEAPLAEPAAQRRRELRVDEEAHQAA